MSQYDDAVVAFEHTLALDPSYVDAWVGKGGALYIQEQNEEALAAFDQALRLAPTMLVPGMARGLRSIYSTGMKMP